MDLNSHSITVSALAGTGGTIIDNSTTVGTSTLTVNQSGSTSFAGTIRDGSTRSLALVKSGSGVLAFSAGTTHSGGTTIGGGTLQVWYTASVLGASGSSLAIASGATLDIQGGGLTVGVLSGNGTITSNYTGGSAALLTVNQYSNSAYAGVIRDGSTCQLGLAKTGSGTLALSGNNSYTLGTTLSNGTLQLGSSSALGGATGTLAINGGILDLNGYSITVASLNGTGGVVTDNGAAAGTSKLTVNQSTSKTFAGAIQDGSTRILALEKLGTGALTLSGSDSFTGKTTVSAGGLTLANGSSSNVVLSGTSEIALNGGSLSINEASSQTFDRTITGTGSLTVSGNGTLTLAGANTYTGGTTVSAGGTLRLSNASAPGGPVRVP